MQAGSGNGDNQERVQLASKPFVPGPAVRLVTYRRYFPSWIVVHG
jgi:hypothetical protein